MKRIAILMLAFIMCVTMISCDSTEPVEEKEPPEIVDVDELLSDLDNQASASLNVGKATTMFGTVSKIAVDHCVIRHQFRSEYSTIYMETEVLADLYKNQYVTIYGVVDRVEESDSISDSDYQYVFVEGRMEDMTLFDEYVADWNYVVSWSDNDHIYDRAEILYDYATSRGDALRVKEDELKSFLVGNWERKSRQVFNYETKDEFTGIHTPEITFFEDGTYKAEDLGNNTEEIDFYRGLDYEVDSGEWFIEDGKFKIDRKIPSSFVYVYKISPDVFICDGDEIFIRREPNEALQ